MSALSTVMVSRPFQWLLMLAFLCCYPLSRVMDPAWAWEMGVVEITQVSVLVAGFLFAGRAYLRMQPGRGAMLAFCVLPIWLILAGRELSWGAVFLAPAGMGADGPIYSSKILWYRPLVAPLAGALLSGAAYLAWRHRLGGLLRSVAASGRFPWGMLAVTVLVALASTLAEGNLGVPESVFSHAVLFEELVELVGYVALVAAQERVLNATMVVERY